MSQETKIRAGFRVFLGVIFVLQGINHFINDDILVRMMPGYLPWSMPLVHLSGVAEVILGVLVFIPRARHLAGWGIIALLIAVFPANIEMAMHPEQWTEVPEFALWLRLPFQPVFMAWAWACCLKGESSALRRPACVGDVNALA